MQEPMMYTPWMYGPLMYDPSTYAQPMYAQPMYAPPMYALPTYAQPMYPPPMHAPPMYAPPMYAQPMYAPPMYALPTYAPPMYAPSSCAPMTNVPAVKFSSKPLSKDALEFKPMYTDTHCLFLTFSNGFPLTENQIFAFFNRMYAPYVEHVYVNRPLPTDGEHKSSLFGKVMFKHRNIPTIVMGEKQRKEFYVDGFQMFCKIFINRIKATNHPGDE